MRLEWHLPHYRGGLGDGEVWHLHSLDAANMRWRILGSITYLGLTRRADWADRLQRWRIDSEGFGEGQEIMVKTMEAAKATALALLTLS